MESKLPKPSGLKRPIAVLKKPSASSVMAKASINSIMPLCNLSNIPEGIVKHSGRGMSPEILRPTSSDMHSRAKLRRSRSACDIRDMRPQPLKRDEFNLAPLPSKTARFGSNVTISGNRPPRIGTQTATKPNVSLPSHHNSLLAKKAKTTNSTINRAPITTRTAATVTTMTALKKITSTSSTATSMSTVKPSTNTGGVKTITKRIPPYDYKARFYDLQDRYKVLKEKHDIKSELVISLEDASEKLKETETRLFDTEEKLKTTQNENECLEALVQENKTKINSLTESLSSTQNELTNLKEKHELLCNQHEIMVQESSQLRVWVDEYRKTIANQEEELLLSREQLFTSNMERKELHNTVMDLRGNIRVFCRVRPPLELEVDRHLCVWNYLDEATVELQSYEVGGYAANKSKPPTSHTFNFDQVFHPNSSQDDIFEMVSPLIQSALDGYNICIFAYGQTGSGKTYTMDGTFSSPGVIPRTVDLLFNAIKNYKRLGWEYEIKATFLEIYNEVLYDLLSNEPKDMEIRMVKNSRNDIYVSNITEEVVESADRLRELMEIAKMNRATAATAGNERSSRSHAVTRIELIGRHDDKNELSVGTINLVDLAGSESPKNSLRMNETKNINRSLSELTNVILALLQKQDHIPYRNSKLTHLLMPSLGGNSKTLMFINVSPFQDCFGESVKSLRFAASVNSCKMTKAKRNRFLNSQLNSSSSSSLAS